MQGNGDYISREAAIAVIYGQHVGGKEACENARPNTYGADLREIVADIEDIPAADVRSTEYCEECRDALLKTIDHYKQLCADVRPALWTDEPIIGTWFMTHNQGQSGFEIHFRTDDKAKYEAVQDECRRQIDHAKPAADVRPVVRGFWVEENGEDAHTGELWCIWKCSECGARRTAGWRHTQDGRKPHDNFCPNCGADMREES